MLKLWTRHATCAVIVFDSRILPLELQAWHLTAYQKLRSVHPYRTTSACTMLALLDMTHDSIMRLLAPALQGVLLHCICCKCISDPQRQYVE